MLERIGLEACSLTAWLHEGLTQAGLSVSPRFAAGIAAINASSSRSATAGRSARSCGNGRSTGIPAAEKRSSCCSSMWS